MVVGSPIPHGINLRNQPAVPIEIGVCRSGLAIAYISGGGNDLTKCVVLRSSYFTGNKDRIVGLRVWLKRISSWLSNSEDAPKSVIVRGDRPIGSRRCMYT